MRLSYCTNGLAHHRPLEACQVLADIGYRGVALTPDVGPLDPLHLDQRVVAELRAFAQDRDLTLVVETGARYALDPRRKHYPNLLSLAASDRERRIDYYRRCCDLAVGLGAQVVSLWSGANPEGGVADLYEPVGPPDEAAWDRLVGGMHQVLALAAERGLRIGFEPEPGMWIERYTGFLELRQRLGSTPSPLGLTLDVGHCIVTEDLPVESTILEVAPYLVHVQLDDSLPGYHLHLPLGGGVLPLKKVLNTLQAIGYEGQAAVELGRDSHRGFDLAEMSYGTIRHAL